MWFTGTFLGYAGAIGLVVTSMSWMANNLRGDGKRAVATAIMISVSGIGGIYSSLVFRQQVSWIQRTYGHLVADLDISLGRP